MRMLQTVEMTISVFVCICVCVYAPFVDDDDIELFDMSVLSRWRGEYVSSFDFKFEYGGVCSQCNSYDK